MKAENIFIISPHPDDEVLGVGGYIAKLRSQGKNVFVLTISGHLPPLYKKESYEQTISELMNAYKILNVQDYDFLKIPATLVKNEQLSHLNNLIYSYIDKIKPEIVLCPFPDRHIDHRVIFESAQVACRPVKAGKNIKMLAAYETLSETFWNAPFIEPNFLPNATINIDSFIQKKIDAARCFKSQIDEKEGPRSISAIKSLSNFRGSQAGFNFGESLYIIRSTM